MDGNKKRTKLSLVNKSTQRKKDVDEKEKESVKENSRKQQKDSHYIQRLKKALSEVIGTILLQGILYINILKKQTDFKIFNKKMRTKTCKIELCNLKQCLQLLKMRLKREIKLF